jgi:hypothetical protein
MKALLLFFSLIMLFHFGIAQHPVVFSVFNESTAIPFTTFFTTPAHPGVQLGTEFNYRNTEKSRTFQSAHASYFYHKGLVHGISLTSEIAYERRIKKNLAIQGMFGLGYTHTFATQPEFIHTPDGYKLKPDRGNARISPSISLQIGYYFNSTATSPKIFLQYQAWVEYPYSPGFIPLMTHVNLHLGYRFFIKTNN